MSAEVHNSDKIIGVGRADLLSEVLELIKLINKKIYKITCAKKKDTDYYVFIFSDNCNGPVITYKFPITEYPEFEEEFKNG